jgi:thiol-disulfide isomerase/thioredoxin
MYARHRSFPTVFVVLALACAAPLAARTLSWEEAPQYSVEINGRPDITTIAFMPATSSPHLLVTSKRFGAPLLLDLAAKAVLEVDAKQLKAVTEYSYESAAVPAGRKVASYTVKSGVTSFGYKGMTVTIRVKESLVGDVPESIILAHSPVYTMLRDAYKPKKKDVQVLKSVKKKTEFVVMFATWCPTCRVVLPRFLKILKEASNPNFSVRYIGIAMGGNEPQAELEKYGHDYPAVIIYQDGKELRRVIGDPPAPLEQVLAGHLKGR